MSKQLRAGKVFIDYTQNADYKTTVSVYSLRAKRERPLVSMPLRWEEVEAAEGLQFEPDAALARLRKFGDLWAPVAALRQTLPGPASRVLRPASPRRAQDSRRRLPAPRSQSGRRLFVRTDRELWLDRGGTFQRWLLDADSVTPAGELPVDPAYYRGDVPKGWEVGSYEVIEGSVERGRVDLWLGGRAWVLEKSGGPTVVWTLRSSSSASS